MGRNGSSGVLTMYVSAAVVINRVEIKKCDEEEEEERHFLAFWHRYEMTVTWLYETLLISICSLYVEDSTLMSIFDLFCFSFIFLGSPTQKSALIAKFAMLNTHACSISFNSWLRCYRIL